MTAPAIAQALGMPRSTVVVVVVRRLGLGRLAALEPKPPVVRYERSAPGAMIHLDIKRLGRFNVEGHCVTGDLRKGCSRRAGWDFLLGEFDVQRPKGRLASVLACAASAGLTADRPKVCSSHRAPKLPNPWGFGTTPLR
jgi:hypothetical protein